jgi:glutamate synthase domain-containing protein 3
LRNRKSDEDDLAVRRGKQYEREVQAIMKEYERAVAPALKRYQAAATLLQQEMRGAYAKASPQKREQMLGEYEEKREKFWLVFVRETGSEASKRDRELAAASIRYNKKS